MRVVSPSAVSDERLLAPRADLGEPRILLDLDAPALVIGEMPVEAVHLMEREEVDVLLHELLRHEVPGDIEVRAAPREARAIRDPDGRNAPRDAIHARLAEDFWREELPHGLNSVEHAGAFARANREQARCRRDFVAFVAESRQACVARDDNAGGTGRRTHANGDRQPRRGSDRRRKSPRMSAVAAQRRSPYWPRA